MLKDFVCCFHLRYRSLLRCLIGLLHLNDHGDRLKEFDQLCYLFKVINSSVFIYNPFQIIILESFFKRIIETKRQQEYFKTFLSPLKFSYKIKTLTPTPIISSPFPQCLLLSLILKLILIIKIIEKINKMHEDYQTIIHQHSLLREQNDQLKSKYKKSLQELMHIIKVNKSLKESLDHTSRNLENSHKEQILQMRNIHKEQIQAYGKELQEDKRLIKEERELRKSLEGKVEGFKIQLNDLLAVNDLLRQQLVEKDVNKSKVQAQETDSQLRKKLAGYHQVLREKQILKQDLQKLKEKVSELDMELLQEKQKYRSEIFSKQTQFLRSKESETEKMKTIQSKYQLLESQLNNYKNMEKYFEDQAKSILDDENVYNNIREQISKISQDFNKYELESSHILLRKREEDAERNRRISELENQVERLKGIEGRNEAMEKQSEFLNKQLREMKEKMRNLQREKKQMLQKNHVLQVMAITDKHRPAPNISERIKQFQMRVRLLLDQNPKDSTVNHTSLQQIVTLKAYVQQLSDLLAHSKKKQQHLSKKNHQYKDRLSAAEKAYRDKIGQFKDRIKNYENLINKLYSTLEQKLKERVPVQVEKEFNLAISHYEQKMMQMSDQILKLRRKISQIQSFKDQKQQVSNSLQKQNQDYKEIISQLSIKLNQYQSHSKKTEETQQELREKNRMIDQLAKQINNLTVENKSLASKLQQKSLSIQKYQQRLANTQQQLQQKQRISSNLSRNSIDTASLIEKVNYLQYELAKQKGNKGDDVSDMEGRIVVQNQQIQNYKNEIDKLYGQLKSEKNEKKSSVVDQYSMISDLQRQITDGEINLLNLQNQLHNKQSQYKSDIQSLEYKNRSLVQQLNSKHSQMMVYYEQLNKKMQNQHENSRAIQLEQYVVQLQHKNHDLIERFSYQANQLNASILALRTTNLSLRNDLEAKQDLANDLKHQLFTMQLKIQKEKSVTGSIIKQNRNEQIEKLQSTIVLLGSEIQVLRTKSQEVQILRKKNHQLQQMYHEDLDRYREALKLLEAKQMQICNSLQLSSQNQQSRTSKVLTNPLQSQQIISQISENSTAFLAESSKPQQATIRSYEAYQQSLPSGQILSNVSISDSPLRRRAVVVKKIM